jgi:chromosomal replication initiation ATPase DnaA
MKIASPFSIGLAESEEEWERKSLLRHRGMDLKWLLDKAARHFSVDAGCLKSTSKVRSVAKVRAVMCYLGMRRIGLTSVSVAKELGLTPAAVSRGVSRASQILEDQDIEGEILEYQ